MIPTLIALGKSKWTWIVVGVVVALTALGVWINNYGTQRYNQGVLAERAAWNVIMAEAVNERNRLNAELQRNRANAEAESARLRAQLSTALTQVQEQIANAETVEDVYSAYRAHSDSLRAQAADNLSRARADYLSSLGNGGNPSPEPDRPKPAYADVRGGGANSRKPGIMVGNRVGK